jgi:tripartite-type tricarboxylate transporter receptor subunit TctC
MNLPRRRFLQSAGAAMTAPVLPRMAAALDYPTQSIRLVVGFAPGGATDLIARIVAQRVSERLGQQIVVENKTGAGSNIAAQAVVSAAPDGYTLLVATGSNAVNATFYENLPFSFVRDIAPVSGLVSYPLVMIVNPSLPAATLGTFIAYARANPGKINMASYGTGTTGHLAGELFKVMTGIEMVHVPYRGEAPAMTDMIGGRVQMMLSTPPGSQEHIRAGKLRPLAVTSARRWDQLPDVPAVGELVPGYEATSWSGIAAPRGTPGEVVDRLNRDFNAVLTSPALKARLSELGTAPLILSPAAFGKLVADETEKWGKVVKLSGVRPE